MGSEGPEARQRDAIEVAVAEKPAVVMSDGRGLTYGALDAAANRLVRVFDANGLTAGDHIAFAIENRPEFFIVTTAARRAGLVYTPCPTRLKHGELEYMVNDCRAHALVATRATLPVAAAVQAPRVTLRLAIDGVAAGWKSFDDALAEQSADPVAARSRGVPMFYSSGTTGRPRGIAPPVLNAESTSDNGTRSSATARSVSEVMGIDRYTVLLSPAPLYHGGPIWFAHVTLDAGGTVVVTERFDAEGLLRMIERHRVTCALLVPTMFIRLLALPEDVRRRYDLSSLRVAIHGAAPCPIEVKERMIEWWGRVLHEYYGGSESIGLTHCDSFEWLKRKGTVGRSLTGPIHILGEDGEELPPGVIGGVYFENASFQYHGDPEKTRNSRDPRGRSWSTMGDIGYLDPDGFLFLTDRKAYTIISGGVNVYPQEAENTLAVHPAVADVAVFGIPDDEMGERVHAVVQPVVGAKPSTDLAAELIEYCRARIADYKCPRSIEFRSQLPRDETGKLYKRLLKDEHWRGRSMTG